MEWEGNPPDLLFCEYTISPRRCTHYSDHFFTNHSDLLSFFNATAVAFSEFSISIRAGMN